MRSFTRLRKGDRTPAEADMFVKDSEGKARLSVIDALSVDTARDYVAFHVREQTTGKKFQGVLLPEVAIMFASALLESALDIIKEKEESPP